jgi:hypothetical protein
LTKYYVKSEYVKKTKTNFIKAVYGSTDGWIWHVTKFEGKGRSIGFGFVKGLFPEWGTFYMSDLTPRRGVNPIPENEWKNLEYVETVEDKLN